MIANAPITEALFSVNITEKLCLVFGETDLSFRLQVGLWRFNQVLDRFENVLNLAVAFALPPFQFVEPVGKVLVGG